MKKILTLLALCASLQFAGAQVKSVADATKAMEKAVQTAQNAKKATKCVTWLKLAKAYIDVFDAPYENFWIGMTRQEMALFIKKKPVSTEVVEVMGQQLSKETYPEKELYFSKEGRLIAMKILKPIDDNALRKAADAYGKACELQPSKSKDIARGLELIASKMVNEAYGQYTIGNTERALRFFQDAVETAARKPLCRLDTSIVYNVGFLAFNEGKKELAEKNLRICLENNYYGQDGDVFAKLAELDQDHAEELLMEGFTKCPESQSILFGLINYYVHKGEGTEKLFSLLDEAKKSDPKNPSIYNVEGDAYVRVGDLEKAMEAYRQSTVIDPKYAVGYIQMGCLMFKEARDIYDKASMELDDEKYNEMGREVDRLLKEAIAPLEKGFELSEEGSDNRFVAADNLKAIYFTLREQSAEYEANYKKYEKIIKEKAE